MAKQMAANTPTHLMNVIKLLHIHSHVDGVSSSSTN
jgi:hypothetical protein